MVFSASESCSSAFVQYVICYMNYGLENSNLRTVMSIINLLSSSKDKSSFITTIYSCYFIPTGVLGLMYTIIIAVVTSACGIFCTYFGSTVPGNTLPAPFSPRKSPRYVWRIFMMLKCYFTIKLVWITATGWFSLEIVRFSFVTLQCWTETTLRSIPLWISL